MRQLSANKPQQQRRGKSAIGGKSQHLLLGPASCCTAFPSKHHSILKYMFYAYSIAFDLTTSRHIASQRLLRLSLTIRADGGDPSQAGHRW